MRVLNIDKDFVRGWLIGNFSPSIYTSKDIEVGVHYVKRGDRGDNHYHKLQTEYNYIISGRARTHGQELKQGDFFVYEKMDKAEVEYLEDTALLVIKLPAVKEDKFYD
jgi:quercetin dioxygenase-like cupin family protein